MALAGDHEDVAGPRSPTAASIAARAVADLDRARRGGEDRAADLLGVLAARIVVGDVDAVGASGRDPAHQRPLAAVAVAAGAEDDDEPALGMRAATP